MRDFSLLKLKELLTALRRNGFQFVRFDEYWPACKEMDRRERVVLLRHDVDRLPAAALATAHLENGLGIRGTYFFRVKPQVFHPELIRQIHGLGHEIGYHYENLTDADGDDRRATDYFRRDLEALRTVAPVVSAAMHSRPLSRWDNRLFWKKHSPHEFALHGEVYRDIDHQKYFYLADSGRNWNADRTVVWDYVKGRQPPHVDGTDGLIALLNKGELPKIHLLIHPNRWPETLPGWVLQSFSDGIINTTKRLILSVRPVPKEV